jgi:hypothetical protein
METVVVAGTRTGTIAAVDTPRRHTGGVLRGGRPDKVTALAFSPDGRLLASSSDSAIVVSDFSAHSAARRRRSMRICSTIRRLAFSPDGRQLASIGHNQVFVWDVDPNRGGSASCRIANREFTRAEWNRFLPGEPIARVGADLLADDDLPDHPGMLFARVRVAARLVERHASDICGLSGPVVHDPSTATIVWTISPLLRHVTCARA